MKCTIEFQMDTWAFKNYQAQEAARILRELADEVEHCEPEIGIDNTITDFDGNEIGRIYVN